MKIQSSHSLSDRGLDPYFTPPEAVWSLLQLESIPRIILEPAAGDGAIVRVIQESGRRVITNDIADYGFPLDFQLDYRELETPKEIQGIITNPPFQLAEAFIRKAISEVQFSAFLLRTNFLESTQRMPLFEKFPPSRVLISSRRLPMMHRHGWDGPIAPSNTCFAWFVWDNNWPKSKLRWFDWADFVPRIDRSAEDLGL